MRAAEELDVADDQVLGALLVVLFPAVLLDLGR